MTKLRGLGRTGLGIVTALAFGGLAAAAPGPSKPANTGKTSGESTTLLRAVRRDAMQVRMHAWRFEKLARNSSTNWKAYDKQWNLIQPRVEDMNVKLDRLKGMRASLTPSEQTALDHSETLAGNVSASTAKLQKLLNERNGKLPIPALRTESAMLTKDAQQIAHNFAQSAHGQRTHS